MIRLGKWATFNVMGDKFIGQVVGSGYSHFYKTNAYIVKLDPKFNPIWAKLKANIHGMGICKTKLIKGLKETDAYTIVTRRTLRTYPSKEAAELIFKLRNKKTKG